MCTGLGEGTKEGTQRIPTGMHSKKKVGREGGGRSSYMEMFPAPWQSMFKVSPTLR